jgi:hypothetical protein
MDTSSESHQAARNERISELTPIQRQLIQDKLAAVSELRKTAAKIGEINEQLGKEGLYSFISVPRCW